VVLVVVVAVIVVTVDVVVALAWGRVVLSDEVCESPFCLLAVITSLIHLFTDSPLLLLLLLLLLLFPYSLLIDYSKKSRQY